MVFAVVGERIVTAVDQKPKKSPRLARLRNVAADPRVSLLVDHYDDDWSRLWWVRADGTARAVSSGAEFDEAVALLVAKYRQYRREPPIGPVIVVEIDRVAGWEAKGP